MRKIDIYITEKLHIDKDISVQNKNELKKIEDLIDKWLDIHNYFDMPKSDFKVFSKETKILKSVILQFPKNTNPYDLREAIGKNIAEKIDSELKLDYYWSLEDVGDDIQIEFSNRIVL